MERRVGHSGGGGGHLLLGNLFRVTVEEHVDHDVPLNVALHGATEAKDFTAEHPVHETNGSAALVVSRDGDVHVLKGRIAMAEGDHWDVCGSSFADGLERE